MRPALYLPAVCIVLLLFSVPVRAQLQFWNLAEQEEMSWLKARKDQKITRVILYRTDERGRLIDTTGADEIQAFNDYGQLVARHVFKYNWRIRKRELLHADSFFYNNGLVTGCRSYEGPNYTPVFESVVKYNAKNLAIRQEHYTLSGYERKPDRTDVFEYDAKNLPKKMVSTSSVTKALNSSRLFFFDAAGRLIRNQFVTASGTITEQLTRDASGRITTYEELYGKELQKTIKYTYDAAGRLSRKDMLASSGFDSFTAYTYQGDNPLFSNMYLQYPGSGGKNDRRHEYTMLVYTTQH